MTTLLSRSAIRRASFLPSSSIRAFSTSPCRDVAWGFIGLGAMGYPMALNLRNKIADSDTLTVFDVNENATKKLVEEAGSKRVQVASDPKEVAHKSDTIVSALPEPHHVKGVFDTILSSSLPNPPTEETRLFIDCSTIDPITSRSVAALVSDHASSPSATFIDSPMSGGVVGARAGTLTFMVGCENSLFPTIEKILLLMGKKVWHMGPQGTGLSGKLANNYALAINNIGAAEAMNLGIRWGIEPKALADLLNSATGRSWPTEINNPVPGVQENSPSSRDYDGGFGVQLMRKDLKLAVTAAREAGAELMLAQKATEVYEGAAEKFKGKDFSVVYRYIGGKE